jgi:23S rRNA (adenine1618-N6)-methyltransferase
MESIRSAAADKQNFHERNKHASLYDFEALVKVLPELSAFVTVNKFGNETIDFANPNAVKALNKALLKCFYRIDFWDIPQGYLCPPIPSRADYIHYVADLLAQSNEHKIPVGKSVKVLDIGVGANCIYPIIGKAEYGWSFVGSDIDETSVKVAKHICESNSILQQGVDIRLQPNKNAIFSNIIRKGEKFDLTICNPPFHASAEEANAGSQRKSRNLGHNKSHRPVLNFGGTSHELWTKGGEVAFVGKLIEESKTFKASCLWFTSLVSKSENLGAIYAMLRRADVADVKTIEMKTGNKITRIVAWTFLNTEERASW